MAEERATQLASMWEVLCLLVTPNACQHVLMKRYFESLDSTRVKEKCGDICSQCKMDIKSCTRQIHRDKLSRLLITFGTGSMKHPGALNKFIKSNIDQTYHKNDVPNKMMGPIHTVCLQLVAKRIIELAISDDKRNLIGKKDLSPLNVIVRLGIDGHDPALLNDNAWEGLYVVTVN